MKPDRIASAAAAVIGIWFLALVPLHPNILDGDLAGAVRGDRFWQLSHAVMFLVGIAGVVLVARIIPTLNAGRIGTAVLVTTILAGFSTSAAGAMEATLFPLVARNRPELIAYDGPLFTSPLFRALTGPWLLFPVCLAALGALVYRVGTQRNAGVALAAGGVSFFAFGMWFVPVVGLLSCEVLGAALLWWAAILFGPTPAGAAGPSR